MITCIRDAEHRPTLDAGLLGRRWMRSQGDRPRRSALDRRVGARPSETRLTVLDAGPDACSLTCGTTNFGDDVFLNPLWVHGDLYVSGAGEIVPEFSCSTSAGRVTRAAHRHGLPFGGRVHVDFVHQRAGAVWYSRRAPRRLAMSRRR